MNTRNKLATKLATSFKPQASSCEEKVSNIELRTAGSNQRTNQPVACGLWLVALLTLFFLQHSVNAQNSFPPVTINLSYPQYQSLKLDGGYQYVNDAGMQGVVLYRLNETTYITFERKCSIDDDAPVSVDGSGLFMKGCNATYSFSDGYPTSGQTTRPLLKYRTSLTGQTLVITDEVAY
ncbi:MAG: hypothetical protein ACKVOQ_12860 [Cyclobacteriaceae bacterium]